RTPVYLVDDGPGDVLGRSGRAAQILGSLGYGDVSVVDGGLAAWREDGYVLVSGVGSLSKGFGEYVEAEQGTPRLEPREAKRIIDDDATPSIVIDVRPVDEYAAMNIPGSTNVPGCEVAYRIDEVVTDPAVTVIVNCAGRTRSIIGTQTLINAGLKNPVFALKGGTMNWQLAGFDLEYGSGRTIPRLTERGREAAEKRIRAVAERCHVRFAGPETVSRWMREAEERTLYLFDVRQPEEYESGHIPGSRSAQGGQLVQALDEYAAVRNGRFVLIDDDELRAVMTAHWLMQMGISQVFVLEGGLKNAADTLAADGLEKGKEKAFAAVPAREGWDAETVARCLGADDDVLILDVSRSAEHKRFHVPRAKWIMRPWLALLDPAEAEGRLVVMTAHDPVQAWLARVEAEKLLKGARVVHLGVSVEEWKAKFPIETGMGEALCPVIDAWYRPYTDIHASREAMEGYFDWEAGLVEKIRKDGCVTFSLLPGD
ncbi:MAG: hypothetical protein J5855_01295, partial [Mailhella sp.]|nr:hypothetical protein [Mailhella sp.]